MQRCISKSYPAHACSPPTADAKRAKRAAKQAVSAAADKMDDDEGDFDFDAANAADGLVASEVGLRRRFRCVQTELKFD